LKAYGYGLRSPRHRSTAIRLRPYAVYGTAYSPKLEQYYDSGSPHAVSDGR
jgi:hypothetical protein